MINWELSDRNEEIYFGFIYVNPVLKQIYSSSVKEFTLSSMG